MTQVRFMTQLPNTELRSWPSFTKGLHDQYKHSRGPSQNAAKTVKEGQLLSSVFGS